jgi:hypothetical protein
VFLAKSRPSTSFLLAKIVGEESPSN